MKRALIFILYHPSSLVEYKHIRDLTKCDEVNELIICRHPYFDEEIIDVYKNSFDDIQILPDIDYETNILTGFIKYFRFKKEFNKKIGPIIRNIDNFNIISDTSAYLPVNALLTHLKKSTKCKNLISIRNDYEFPGNVHVRKTLRSLFYTTMLCLNPVYAHRLYGYLYIKEPRNKIINIRSPYFKLTPSRNLRKGIPVYFIQRSVVIKDNREQNIVVIYTDSDSQLIRQSRLSESEYKKRLRDFFIRLSEHYRGYRIICKPHPQNHGKIMVGMENISYELYAGRLTSQMHLDMIASEVRACYSISSSSLLYSADMGIPSYTLYQYLDFKGEYPKAFFENNKIKETPFLYNVKDLSEIGIIDSLTIEPIGKYPHDILDEALK